MAIEQGSTEHGPDDVFSGLDDPAIDAAMQQIGQLIARMDGGTVTSVQVLNVFERGTDLAMQALGAGAPQTMALSDADALDQAALSQLADQVMDVLQQASVPEAEV